LYISLLFPHFADAIALLGCNLLFGYGGLLSFGHAMFMGFGAYGAAIMAGTFGINVPRMITLTYGLGVGLAALAGVLSAPINQVRPLMGADLIIVVFAVVVIGGMGSIMGSIITGFALGVIEGLTKYFYPEASNTVVFVLMVLVLLIKPAGLTGRAT
jgi:branched-subunit amino acid ABC-type transport system permease component